MKNEHILYTVPQLYLNLKKISINQDSICLGEHFHSAIEIVYVKQGSILCWINEDFIRIPENHICVVGSNVIHRLTYDAAPAQIHYLQIDIAKIIDLIYPQYADIPLIFDSSLNKYALFSDKTYIFKLFQDIFNEIESEKPFFETATLGGLIQLTSYLQREMLVSDLDRLYKNTSFVKISPIILYANEHYSEKVCLDEISNIFHIDKYYLCKIFKKSTGITFFQYLNNIRIQNAEKMLMTTNKSISQIALECGFSTIQYFNSFFTKSTGYSPSTYRKMYYKSSTV